MLCVLCPHPEPGHPKKGQKWVDACELCKRHAAMKSVTTMTATMTADHGFKVAK